MLSVNLIMLMLLEIPLIGYAVAPEKWTPAKVEQFKGWLAGNGRRALAIGSGRAVFGVALILPGLLNLSG